MIKLRLIAVLSPILFFISKGHAQSVGIGADAAIAGVQNLLVSPALPSLDGGKFIISPQIGTTEAIADGSDATTGPNGTTGTYNYKGNLKGNLAGLSLTVNTKGDFGYFLFLYGINVSGEYTGTMDDEQVVLTLRNIKSTGYVGVAGINYRIVGDDQSTFAMGTFAGPSIANVTSSLDFNYPALNKPGTSTLDTSLPGLFFGFQFMWRMGKFRINPYLVGNIDLASDTCKPLKLDQDDPSILMSLQCYGGKSPGVDVENNFAGTGLNVGYGGFKFNLYAQNAREYYPLKVSSFSLSYGFAF
jgi:hypothetical protein